MITTNSTFIVTAAPEVNITANRNRVKSYGQAVYMKSGTNFEIEIFNPKSSRILAKIEIDGKLISTSGIVINPGARIYLERWIDESKKLVFSTYEVENSIAAKNAIKLNGNVKVSFYDEIIKSNYILTTGTTSFSTYPSFTTIADTNPYSFTSVTCANSVNTSGILSNYSSAFNTSNINEKSLGVSGSLGPAGTNGIRGIETGRTEIGESSSQDLISTSGDFTSYAMHTVELQILPESSKPVDIVKIRAYCTNCGTRVRSSSWKFCPSCGDKM